MNNGATSTPSSRRVGNGKTQAARPPINDPSLRVGDVWIARAEKLVNVVILDAAGALEWFTFAGTAAGFGDTLYGSQSQDLQGAGVATFADMTITARSRIVFSPQVGANVTGFLSVSSLTPGVGFTITSSAGAGDNGLTIYAQHWEPVD